MAIESRSFGLDLSAANDAAMADLQAELSAPAPEPAEAPAAEAAAPEPVTTQPEPVAEATAPTTEAPLFPEVKLPSEDDIPSDPEELKKGWLRHRDYTKKTMSLAEERKAFAAEQARIREQAEYFQRAQQELNAWRQLASNQDALERFAEQQRQAANIPAADEPLTYAQTQQLLQQGYHQIRQAVLQEAQQEVLKFEASRQDFIASQQLEDHAAALLTKYPVLQATRGVTRLIAADAYARKPKDVNEFKQFMAEEAEDRASYLRKMLDNHEKAAIMRHAKVNAPSIAPQGGGIPAVQAPAKRLKLGSEEFFKSIENDLLLEQQNSR